MLDKLKGLGNMASMLRQAEEFKEALKDLQTELQDMQIIVDSDQQLVRVTVNGQAKILDLVIDPEQASGLPVGEIQSRVLATVVKAQNRSVYVANERRDQLFARYKIDKAMMADL